MKLLALRAGLALGSILLALLALELALRVIGYDLNPSSQWRFDSLLGWTIDPDGTSADAVTPQGFRQRPREESETGARKLLILGDSFTAGMSLPYGETYPGRLDQWLNRGPERWEVVSRAVDDWGTAQQYLALSRFLRGEEEAPKAIVLQIFPFNDFCNDLRVLAQTCSLQDAHRPYFELREGSLESTWLEPAKARLRNQSLLFGWVENRLATPVGNLPAEWQPEEADQDARRRSYFLSQARAEGLQYEGAVYALLPEAFQPPVIQEGWRTVAALLEAIRRTAVEGGAEFIPVVIPFSKTFSEADWEEVATALEGPMQREYGTERFEAMLRSSGAEPISVRRRIEAAGVAPERYFISPSDGHLSAYGHRQIARWILDRLNQASLSRLPVPPADSP